jgi:thermitase
MMRPSRPGRYAALVLAGLLCLSILTGRPTPARGDIEGTGAAFVPGEILVAYNTVPATLQAADREHVLEAYGATRVGSVFSGPTTESSVDIVRVPQGREFAAIRALNRDPRVRYAEPNYVYTAFATPNDPHFAKQWAYTTIQAPAAWDIVTGATTITIAVIDSGIDPTHPDLAGKLVPGYDYVDNDDNPRDLNGHGTHVAGIAAAITNNGIGVAGMAWGARIMPLRALDEEGTGNSAGIASAIGWAHLNGAKIINLSLGGEGSSQTLQNAITHAHNDGILVVAAMGNRGDSVPLYPAAYANVMAVAATTRDDIRAGYSSYGVHCDIAAPGGFMTNYGQTSGIYSTMPTYDVYDTTRYFYQKHYDYHMGTSQAAPFVSGLAALIWSVKPSLTPDQVQQTIQSTAVDLGASGWDQYYGWGRINALAAVESVLALAPPTLWPITEPGSDGTLWVDWSDVSYASSYTLQEDAHPSFDSPTTAYSGAASHALLSERPSGTWYYRVRAERLAASKVGDWSNVQAIQIRLVAPLLAPIGNNGASTYVVTWQGVAGAAGYRLQESATADFATSTTLSTGNVLAYTVSDQAGGTWYYRVQAYNASESSDWSTVRSAMVKPAAPTLDAIVPDAAPDAYHLTWSSTVGAAGYRLQESPNAGFSAPSIRYLGTSTTYTITGQPAGQWHYRVEAYNEAGYSPPSNTRVFTVTVPSVPAPTLLPIDNVDGDAAYDVRWTTVTTATGYLLEESSSAFFAVPALVYSGPLALYTPPDQTPGTWHYRVRAVTAVGPSPWSNAQAVLVPGYAYLPLVMRSTSDAQGFSAVLGPYPPR